MLAGALFVSAPEFVEELVTVIFVALKSLKNLEGGLAITAVRVV